MVAVLIRLRFRVLSTTLQRNTFQLVAVIMSATAGLLLLGPIFVGLVIASAAPPAATQAVIVMGGSTLLLGWMVVPLLFDGVERTLDPAKLARFPVRAGQLMAAMFVVGVAWIPGIVTVIASLGTMIAWLPHPVSPIVAAVTGLVGAGTCIVGSRVTASAVGALLKGRGFWRAAVTSLVVLLLAAPIVSAALRGASTSGRELLAAFGSIVDVAAWTPFGAVWSIPGRIALGDTAGAVGSAGVALGTLISLLVVWRLMIGASLRSRGNSARRAVGAGRLGAFAWVPSTPVGAIAARSLIYWFRDTRQAKQLILIPVLPALMLLSWQMFHIDGIAIAIGPIVATILPLSVFAGLSFDGTAFAAQLAAGVRGIDDRRGRAVALLVITVPSAIVVQVVVAMVIDRTADLPALLGLTLGTLLVSIGVVSVSSARVVVPMARAGQSPFSAQAGAATVSIVASYAVTGISGVLALPSIVLAIVAIALAAPVLGWLALITGLLLGTAIVWGGVVLGGRILDSSAPTLLARLRLIRS